ncbi:MAG: retention module-containing protein, partial [Thiobacillus sp.]
MDASVSTPQAVATIIAVEGQAFARDPAGQMRPLKPGDVLLEGDTIVTMPGGQVQLAFLDGQMLTLLPNESFLFSAETSPTSRPEVAEAALPAGEAERIIQALERGENIDDLLDPTAAGLEGGGGDGGSSFVRLLRIAEGVDSTTLFEFESAGLATLVPADPPENSSGSDIPAVTPLNDAPTTSAVTLAAIAEDSGARTITQAELLANAADIDGDTLAASGLAISAGDGTLVDNGNGTWSYTPASNDDSNVSFSYTISDGAGGTVGGSATLDITPVNDAPTATAVSASGAEDAASISITLSASDIDGTIASHTISSLPANGTLYADAALTTAVAAGDSLSSATVYFVPAANWNGSTSFNYTATDNGGETSNSATASITVNPLNNVANLNDNAPVLGNYTVSLDENVAAGTAVQTVAASDADNDT